MTSCIAYINASVVQGYGRGLSTHDVVELIILNY